MRDLHFNVNGQRIGRAGDFRGITKGSRGYLRAVFAFDDDWAKMKKAASFWAHGTEHAMPIANNMCMVPDEACDADTFEVSVTGERNGMRVTTGRVKVYQGV